MVPASSAACVSRIVDSMNLNGTSCGLARTGADRPRQTRAPLTIVSANVAPRKFLNRTRSARRDIRRIAGLLVEGSTRPKLNEVARSLADPFNATAKIRSDARQGEPMGLLW